MNPETAGSSMYSGEEHLYVMSESILAMILKISPETQVLAKNSFLFGVFLNEEAASEVCTK